jgi:hypothetical protein
MAAVHVDPLGLCPAADAHVHVASLADFADRLLGPSVPTDPTADRPRG